MKLAILCEYILPETGAVVNRMIHFATYFARFGITTTIFAPQRNNFPSFRLSPQVDIIRYANLRHLFQLLKHARVHLILSSSPAPKYPFFASLIARILRIPCIVDVRDPPAYAMRHGLNVNPFSYQYYKTLLLEFIAYHLATEIFIVTKYQRMLLERMFRVSHNKFTIVINGGEREIAYRDETLRQQTRAQLGLPSDAILLFFNGALGGYDFGGMLRAIGERLFADPRIYLLIISGLKYNLQPLREIKRHFAGKPYREHFLLMDSKSPKEMAKYLSAADIGLIPLLVEWDYTIPVKSYEFMLAELPIAIHGSPRMPLFRMARVGQFGIATSNWEAYLAGLNELVNNSGLRKRMGATGKALAEKYLLRDYGAQTALKRLKILVKD